MSKAIGFRRNIYLDWMDAAAAFAAAGDDAATVRARLDPIVAHTVKSDQNRGVALTILVNTWVNSAEEYPALHATALQLFHNAPTQVDRVWLHYGMTSVVYPFFHQTVRVIGKQTLLRDSFSSSDIKRAMIADRGHLGALEKAVERVLFSLRDWGVLRPGEQKATFLPVLHELKASSVDVQTWLLAVALTVHPGEEVPFLDLIRLPEHFPFAFTLSLDHVRRHPWFAVQRQGAALDMVRLA
ncbi:MAG: hypothetical protein KIT77_25140 [Caldilinea sp.]|nr:hypothetical protein [Caldilinea sp.]